MLLLLTLACGGDAPAPPPPAPPPMPSPPAPSLGGVKQGATLELAEPVCEGAAETLEFCREPVLAFGIEGELLVDMGRTRFLSELELAGVAGTLVVEIEEGRAADLAFVHPDARQADAVEAWLGTEGWVESGQAAPEDGEGESLAELRFYTRGPGEAWVLAVSEQAGLAMRPSTRTVAPAP
ncbi:MAG: hypothetical protein H6741_26815 [Alphaproteobacteria bacterium]|nr:hypothetical protein [Alphaproteobacteria bacterium]